MGNVQFRIGTVTFSESSRPTWESRSAQILDQLAGWAREGWRVSRLNATRHLRLRARGFCVLLERPLAEPTAGSFFTASLPNRYLLVAPHRHNPAGADAGDPPLPARAQPVGSSSFEYLR